MSPRTAKLQGEVLKMKQENNKVANDLQAKLDHVAPIQKKKKKIGNIEGRYGSERRIDTESKKVKTNRSDVDVLIVHKQEI